MDAKFKYWVGLGDVEYDAEDAIEVLINSQYFNKRHANKLIVRTGPYLSVTKKSYRP